MGILYVVLVEVRGQLLPRDLIRAASTLPADIFQTHLEAFCFVFVMLDIEPRASTLKACALLLSFDLNWSFVTGSRCVAQDGLKFIDIYLSATAPEYGY